MYATENRTERSKHLLPCEDFEFGLPRDFDRGQLTLGDADLAAFQTGRLLEDDEIKSAKPIPALFRFKL